MSEGANAALEPLREGLARYASELPRLDAVSAAVELGDFERELLVLCAASESDAGLRRRLAAASPAGAEYPTLALALALFPGGSLEVLAPSRPFRRLRLVEVGAGEPLLHAPLRISERTLFALHGIGTRDEQLAGMLSRVEPPEALPRSHARLVEHIASVLAAWEGAAPALVMHGPDADARRAVAAAAFAHLGLPLHALRATSIPLAAAERETFAQLWDREWFLDPSALYLDLDDADPPEAARAVRALDERLLGPVVLAAREPARAGRAHSTIFEVARPTPAEQRALWRRALGDAVVGTEAIERLVNHFDLGEPAICSVARFALVGAADAAAVDALWELCRVQARARMGELAQLIEPRALWDDLVLPDEAVRTLEAIRIHLRNRGRVHEDWGFAERSSRGLGVSALFTGASGTGKTTAAEVLAGELRLDLYRIDLSQVVSKYIGETEKNLRRVFDAAEASGAILLFDEADAIFGKRTEVKDSHDRYANIEVSYLLQRMEAYRGLAILTTNMNEAIDPAFLRRLHYVVDFPFPGPDSRARIWERAFGRRTPTEDLDFRKLGRLQLAGGNIRNIALGAALLAADRGEPVRMVHVAQVARREFFKLQRPLPEAELADWK